MNDSNQLWYSENIAIFRGICPSEYATSDDRSGSGLNRLYRKGEYLFRANDPVDRIFLLESGRVKVGSYSDSGKEIIKAILQPGEVFGEQLLLGQDRRHNFAQAVDKEVRVCALDLAHLRQLIHRNPEFGLRITRTLSLRVDHTERRLEALVSKDARTRIVEFLRDLADENGRPVGDEILIYNFLTHKDIASLTATSRQTVTSVLNELRDQNLIYFDRKRFLIRNIDRLMASVQQPMNRMVN